MKKKVTESEDVERRIRAAYEAWRPLLAPGESFEDWLRTFPLVDDADERALGDAARRLYDLE